jgi:hypothetical protein
MGKLQRQIKQGAKRRAHKRTVQRRKEARAATAAEEKAREQQERVEREAERELAEQDAARSVTAIEEAMNRHGGLVVERVTQDPKSAKLGIAGVTAGKKKNLSHKQLMRKQKMQEKGERRTDQMTIKTMDKFQRVKLRARTRNADLAN